MNYYFDESGNWAIPQNERNLLILGGLLIKHKSVVKNLATDFNIFKNNYHLRTIHANELDHNQRDELYGMIENFLKSDDVVGLLRCFRPSVLKQKTLVNADETYIDLASTLVNDLSFGDEKVNIEYDIKFHYAYPENVISNLNKGKPDYFNITTQNYKLTRKGFEFNNARLSNLIEKIITKNPSKQLNRFFQLINNSEINENIKTQQISNYLWTELLLKIEGNETMRTKFKDKIENNSENRMQLMDVKSDKQRFNLRFTSKFDQSVGVQIIDILSNMVYRFGVCPKKTAPSSVKGIYQNIMVQEVQ